MACSCPADQLCERCYGRELIAKRGQARVLGETRAERVCRGELWEKATWPEHEPKTMLIAWSARWRPIRASSTNWRWRVRRVPPRGGSDDHRGIAASRLHDQLVARYGTRRTASLLRGCR